MFKRIDRANAKPLRALSALLVQSLPTFAQTGNCCGVDGQCTTKEDWVRGYYAFRHSQCGAPPQAQQGQQARQQRGVSANDNCCFSGWQCNSDAEWISGYWAFQNDQGASQSHWEEQMRKRESADASSYQRPRRKNNQPRQDSDQGPKGSSGYRNWEEESITVTEDTITIGIDPSNEEEREYETEGGLTISLQPLSRERLCEFASYLSICK